MLRLHRRPPTPVATLLLLLVAGSACATTAPEDTALRPVTSPMRLIVDNRCFNDVRIYAIQNGVTQIPLGRVEAVSTREVVLPASLVAARTIRLVAVPLAHGRQTAIDLDLYDGGTAIWYLQNDPAFSRLVKR
jgi:hypothetical protein